MRGPIGLNIGRFGRFPLEDGCAIAALGFSVVGATRVIIRFL
jgi:hypothetical protein